MNRRGFSLKKVRKTIPQKKIPQTDAIFKNVPDAHQPAETDRSILRISIDRITQLADKSGLRIVLVYYPPYQGSNVGAL